jgi:hypothetical protein
MGLAKRTAGIAVALVVLTTWLMTILHRDSGGWWWTAADGITLGAVVYFYFAYVRDRLRSRTKR